jgi:phytoene/squalene synthetase
MSENSEFTHSLARKGTPNLYLAARFFEPEEKFRAFLSTYAAMRVMDDIVDHRRARGELSVEDIREISDRLDNLVDMIIQDELDQSLPYSQELELAFREFEIPKWPFVKLVEAMKYDLHNDRFDTPDNFLEYSEGAAVAPGAVFMHLAGCSFDGSNSLVPPRFNIHDAAQPLAVFSYLVHILRDFKKDFVSGSRPLVYLDTESMDKFHLNDNDLELIARSGKQSLKFTKMVQWYYHRITFYQQISDKTLRNIESQMPEDGRFALNFIYELYSATAAQIAACNYNIASNRILLTNDDILMATDKASWRSRLDSGPIKSKLESILSGTGTPT